MLVMLGGRLAISAPRDMVRSASPANLVHQPASATERRLTSSALATLSFPVDQHQALEQCQCQLRGDISSGADQPLLPVYRMIRHRGYLP